MFANHIGRIFMGVFAAIVLILPISLYAQSPLTVQPSTGRVGVGNTSPEYTLDVSGTVNAQYLRGNGSQLTNLPASGTSTAIDKVTANTTVANTSTETNLYSFSVPGGTLGTNNVLRLTIQITDLDRAAFSICDLRFKYGGTTLALISLDNSEGSTPLNNGKALITWILAADGVTNAQVGTALSHIFYNGEVPYMQQGTSAVDSTATQTLAVTVDWDAGSGRSITLGQAILEKL